MQRRQFDWFRVVSVNLGRICCEITRYKLLDSFLLPGDAFCRLLRGERNSVQSRRPCLGVGDVIISVARFLVRRPSIFFPSRLPNVEVVSIRSWCVGDLYHGEIAH